MACKARKISYPSEDKAWEAAIRRMQVRGFCDLKVYHCKPCFSWHLMSAKVQLHEFFWKPKHYWPKRVRSWFKERETFDWIKEELWIELVK